MTTHKFRYVRTPRITDCFVANPRHSWGYGCGSLRALGARMRLGIYANVWVVILLMSRK